MKTIFKIWCVCMICWSCDISDNTVEPVNSFLKIYDDSRFESSFIPIDFKQTANGEFIILGARRIEGSDFSGVFLMKVDELGEFVVSNNLSEEYVHPVKSLINIDEQFYFVAMNSTSLQANLIAVDPATLEIVANPIGGVSYPVHVSQDGAGLLLLSYNNVDKTTDLSRISTTGARGASASYRIGAGADVEAPIIAHFTRTGKQLPFFAGVTSSGLYYFNGFYNYTLSMVFTNFGDEPIGVLQGQQEDGGISAAQHLSGSNFALSRFNFGDNYIVPSQDILTSGLSSSSDIVGNPYPELVPDAPMILEKVAIDGEEVLMYASNTKAGKIILMSFSSATGELLATKYIGFSDPYSVASIISTHDDGLAVLSTVEVAGRFPRISLVKLSKDELGELK